MSTLRNVELPVAGELVGAVPAAVRSESPLAQALRRLRKSKTAMFGGVIAVALVVVAIFADVLAPYSPTASDQRHTFEAPSRAYPLGTDQLARDMLSPLIPGTRTSLAVAIPPGLLARLIGVRLPRVA